jgi:hypothetical protein
VGPQHPAEHPLQVSIDGGQVQAEHDGTERTRHIGADAGELEQVRMGGRKAAPGHDGLGSRVEQACTPVIAKATPGLQHRIAPGGGEGLHVGEADQKSLMVLEHRLHPGLLQHELADQAAIGAWGPPPWEVPGRPGIPLKQGLVQRLHLGGIFTA